MAGPSRGRGSGSLPRYFWRLARRLPGQRRQDCPPAEVRERRAKLRDLGAPTTVRVSHVAAAWLVTAPRLDPATVLAKVERYMHDKPCGRWR